jgi:glycosyltransferase involved in cell wall biosynthesis
MSYELTLFFTRNTSLQTWAQTGTIEREAAIYQALSKQGVHIRFVTYGDAKDLVLRKEIAGIKLLCNRWRLPRRYYEMLLTRVAPLFWHKNTIFKSNQTKGANVALRAAQKAGKPFIARCGYMWSQLAISKSGGILTPEVKKAIEEEKMVFTNADAVVVTTQVMRDYVVSNYDLMPENIHIIPNYVLTEAFKPNRKKKPSRKRVCYIGRLEDEKNPLGLLEAVRDMDLDLILIGDGSLQEELEEKAKQYQIRAIFTGNQPHYKLPEFLNSSDIFVLPSPHEGHPKALIEAMACGLPVIGTNVSGIRELISHKENGYLCGTSSQEIRDAIQTVLDDDELQIRMGRNARDFVLQNFSLEKIVEMELALLDSLWEN